jgi:hypothetical protein
MPVSEFGVREEERDVLKIDARVSVDVVSRDVVDLVECADAEYVEVFEDDVRDGALEGWATGKREGAELGCDGMTESSYSLG